MAEKVEKNMGVLGTSMQNGNKNVLAVRQKLVLGNLLNAGTNLLHNAKNSMREKKARFAELIDMNPTNKMSLVATDLTTEEQIERMKEVYKLGAQIELEEMQLQAYITTHNKLFGDLELKDFE